MEAMACSLPIVCSIIGSTPAMLSDGVEGFLVPQADEAALGVALAALADNPDLRLRMGAAARRRALMSFDRRITAGLLLEAIRASHGDGQIELASPPIWSLAET
jgi:colanic acid/amylovoran biosynthesis glycosyltransferase